MRNYALASAVIGIVLVGVGVAINDAGYLLLGVVGGGLATLAYLLTMRWIDGHGDWEAVARR